MTKLTPMMQQYMKIKNEYQDALVFFRLGDFYELFYEDAEIAARELEITLTQRDSTQKNGIPMCGVPHHSASGYLKTLVDKGYKVAICEQMEDPKEAKGVVKREVIQLITPGTVMDTHMLTDNENNYLASLSYFSESCIVLIYIDLSTGESTITKIKDGWARVLDELSHQPVKEVVIHNDLPLDYQNQLQSVLHMILSFEEETKVKKQFDGLTTHLTNNALKEAFNRLLHYIEKTQKRSLEHIQAPQYLKLEEYLTLDKYSKRNLEISETILRKEKYGSLSWVLDQTVTAMGSRLLKKWLERPLINRKLIETRLDIVESFYNDFIQRENLIDILKTVYDLERIVGRVSFGNANARDLVQLKKSLIQIPKIKAILSHFTEKHVLNYNGQLDELQELVKLLQTSIIDDPPVSIKEAGMIKDGFHKELDKFRSASRNGKTWIAQLEKKEKEITGIKSLKVGFNRVFGYYIEITKSNLSLIPEGRYERKQTLANAERFITEELKEKEALILEAEEKMVDLEYEIFLQIREEVKQYISDIQNVAKKISELDVFQSLASVSEKNRYTRPEFSNNQVELLDNRHPVIETVMKDENFVPNDIHLTSDKNMLLITGPNMSGKSTYMRQLALTIIMAQIGCFIPASQARLRIFDQIFTRIGAADDLVQGQSTFMVEMLETNHALQNATNRSLILLDEIGRGTSTYDGMALAQAIIEYIHDELGATTLFSTHYHELTALEDTLSNLQNVHVQAEEHDDEIVFLHKVGVGAADESYGIHVARLANVPENVLKRADEILKILENKEHQQPEVATSGPTGQMSLFVHEPTKEKNVSLTRDSMKLENELRKIKLLELTPMDAMNELYRLQQLLDES